ncbi:hypothetical protein GE09DRAFT_1231119 [Coniochaeta sp. 2T2.1]|nr:hypothetical protein GE09DRAFT_1231119 [Coniochaeta sp. 2T2.1]
MAGWPNEDIIALTALLVMIVLGPVGWLIKRTCISKHRRRAPTIEVYELDV